MTEAGIEMRDWETGVPLLMPRKLSLAYDYRGESVKPAIEFHEHAEGFDLHLTFKNDADAPKPLGAVHVGYFTLGREATFLEPRDAPGERVADIRKFQGASYVYPTRAYSPVMVLRNATHAVGLSLLYPVLEYKHDVRVSLVNSDDPGSESLEGGRGLAVDFRLSNCGDERDDGVLKYPAMLPPGESRTYVIAVRVTNQPDLWLKTLAPYKRYFEELHGSVTYSRDARPIMPWSIAEAKSQSQDNPMGFFGSVRWRPDIFGWTSIIKSIQLNSANYSRLMLMAPGGLYPTATDRNPPFEMTTPWRNNPQLIKALDPDLGFALLTKNRRELGLWWGNPLKVSRSWDSPVFELMDPSNEKHRELAFAEVDTAKEAGAKTIVLGNFSPETQPVWSLIPWLRELRQRYPDVKFVVSPMPCDVMHVLSPGVATGWDPKTKANRPEDILRIRTPHYLADLLAPGHETWVMYSYDEHRTRFKVNPPSAAMNRDMRMLASLGYVPMFNELGGEGKKIKAAESWLSTVPADLRESADTVREETGEPAEDEWSRRVEVKPGEEGEGEETATGITRISKPLVDPGKPAKRVPTKPVKKPTKSKTTKRR